MFFFCFFFFLNDRIVVTNNAGATCFNISGKNILKSCAHAAALEVTTFRSFKHEPFFFCGDGELSTRTLGTPPDRNTALHQVHLDVCMQYEYVTTAKLIRTYIQSPHTVAHIDTLATIYFHITRRNLLTFTLAGRPK